MKASFRPEGWLAQIENDFCRIPFSANQGFFLEWGGQETEIACSMQDRVLTGSWENITVQAEYTLHADHVRLHLQVANGGETAFTGKIGFHMGVDSFMANYPQWHEPFFPTMLRCEKTHLWGYYMNTAGNALAVATENPVASYDIRYNRLADGDYGHRILGTDILLIHDGQLPQRHPDGLRCLMAGEVYKNTVYLIPVREQSQIGCCLQRIAGIPIVQADKYTLQT
jgi:hypothetical protein